MRNKVEGRKLINIVCIITIVLLLFSCFFSNQLSIFLYLKPRYEYSNNTEIHFIDVGQGDAIAIKFDSNKVMLIDTGTYEYRTKLKYYLDNIILRGTKTIDYLVLTHIDNDHSGNMDLLLKEYNIGVLYRPKLNSTIEDSSVQNSSEIFDNVISIATNKNIPMRYNEAGITLVEGNSIISWLSPCDLDLNDSLKSNEYSTVIKLNYKNRSALLTGDINSNIEEQLLSLYTNGELDADILKLAHHGSANSNSIEFFEAVSPDFACVSVGENTYGHPSNKVLNRIIDYDNKNNKSLFLNLYSTMNSGNVIFTLSDEIVVNTISNIDDFSFASYYTYVFIAVLILILYMIIPYYKVFKKDIRFIIQNKKFEKYLERENT